MLEAGLIVSRSLHYAATTFLFGATLYPFYGFATGTPTGFIRAVRPWLGASAILSLLSLIGWFLFSAANMAGDASAMFDTSVLLTIVKTMSFGKLWLARLGLSLLLVLLVLRRPNGATGRWAPLVSAFLLVSLAGTGHSLEPESSLTSLHYLADGAHLLAAGAWLGALWPLAIALRTSPTAGSASEVLVRFSWMGQLAVGVLLASGLLNGWFLVGSAGQLFTTAYGRLLCLKVGLFLAMLAFAAANRFWFTPQLLQASVAPAHKAALARLRANILAEQVLGLLLLGAVGWLGTLQPPLAG